MNEPYAYAFEPVHFRILQEIEKGLHGNGTNLTGDQRRDLANRLSLILSYAVELKGASNEQ
jgi:hypothetical protein